MPLCKYFDTAYFTSPPVRQMSDEIQVPNTQGGGTRNTRGHYDVPMRDCTVTLDNDVIIERGRIADDKMRVMRVAR